MVQEKQPGTGTIDHSPLSTGRVSSPFRKAPGPGAPPEASMTRLEAAGTERARAGRQRGAHAQAVPRGSARQAWGVCKVSLSSPRAPGSVTTKSSIPDGRPGSHSGALAGVSPPHRGFRPLLSAAVACPGRVRVLVTQRSLTREENPPAGPAPAPAPHRGARARLLELLRAPASSNFPPASLRGCESGTGPPPRAKAAGKGRRPETPRQALRPGRACSSSDNCLLSSPQARGVKKQNKTNKNPPCLD